MGDLGEGGLHFSTPTRHAPSRELPDTSDLISLSIQALSSISLQCALPPALPRPSQLPVTPRRPAVNPQTLSGLQRLRSSASPQTSLKHCSGPP